LKRNPGVSTPNILDRKSEDDPLPYCKTRAEAEGFNQSGPLVSCCHHIRGVKEWGQSTVKIHLCFIELLQDGIKQHYDFSNEHGASKLKLSEHHMGF
jgi:hypothetical protein